MIIIIMRLYKFAIAISLLSAKRDHAASLNVYSPRLELASLRCRSYTTSVCKFFWFKEEIYDLVIGEAEMSTSARTAA
jgi:hypothetical protein